MRELIHDTDQLDALPPGARIVDEGVRATKTDDGAWLYETGMFWEPIRFPVRRIK